jgi:hypothetical protein
MLMKLEDVQAQKGSWFRFSSQFPADSKTGWASGKTFVVSQDTVLVDYPVSRIIANGDWVNLDLTNDTNPTLPGVPHPTTAQAGTLQMYPATVYILYQISVGMKKGPYFSQFYFVSQSNPPVYQLGSSAIQSGIADPVYRYLGAQYPKDSPEKFPTWFLYSIMQAPKMIVQLYMDGGDTMAAGVLYGKATVVFRVNKCKLSEITAASIAGTHLPIGQNQTINVTAGLVASVTGGSKGDTYVTNSSGTNLAVASGLSVVVGANYVVHTGSGSAIITREKDLDKWQQIQEKATYIPYYNELTNY